MRNFYSALLVCVVLLAACDFQPRDVSFYVWEDERWEDGRFLLVNPDTACAGVMPDTSRRYELSRHNLYARHADSLLADKDTVWERLYKKGLCYALRVHRASERIDTLYYLGVCYSGSEPVRIGYISGGWENKDWLVVESKKPGLIVGREDLSNPPALDARGVLGVYMEDCTYRGQEKVFESKIVDYWIASRHTADLYGPFNMTQLKRQLRHIGISLPLKLDGGYDRYSHSDGADGNFFGVRPKAFYWPHHRSRKGTVIE